MSDSHDLIRYRSTTKCEVDTTPRLNRSDVTDRDRCRLFDVLKACSWTSCWFHRVGM